MIKKRLYLNTSYIVCAGSGEAEENLVYLQSLHAVFT